MWTLSDTDVYFVSESENDVLLSVTCSVNKRQKSVTYKNCINNSLRMKLNVNSKLERISVHVAAYT